MSDSERSFGFWQSSLGEPVFAGGNPVMHFSKLFNQQALEDIKELESNEETQPNHDKQ